ncbi:MAG: single-stranded-DNA-specific exonuclease RecJ [Deltaproteobacteria bacterium]|jgi:single-stranded-DNA-specific exonuclease|nr:single-stranded-DNA-specific exonuclease RecJ [Deltaproteobacteria bacterium]
MLWKYRPSEPQAADEMAHSLNKPLKFGRFLSGRGFKDSQEVLDFLNADLKDLPGPETMPGMDKAVELLLDARRKDSLIAVSGDYDADGLTGTALLKRFLTGLGFRILTRIPNRLEEGYGLSPTAVRELHQQQVSLLITVDSGVSDDEAVKEALKLGLEVIITDHHNLPPVLPNADAIINPHLGGGWESTALAGVGVAFMLAWATRKACMSLGLTNEPPSLVEHLCLVALGTIADMSPLIGPNRTMVRHGLEFLKVSEWPGFVAMRRSLKLDNQTRISVRDVAFKIAPRLNAAGRLGSAEPALEILLTQDPIRAEELARRLDELNRQRQETQSELVEEALEMLEHDVSSDGRTVVLVKEGWPKGVLGLVASKVAEKSGKPTIILTIEGDMAVGSGRTAGGFNLYHVLTKVRQLCFSMGGHSQAAGLKLEMSRLEAFKEAFEQAACSEPFNEAGETELLVDMDADLADLETLADSLSQLEPFGQGHPAPVFILRNVKVLDAVTSKWGRVTLRLSDGFTRQNVSGFNLSSRVLEVGPIMDVAVVFEPDGYNSDFPWKLLDFKSPVDSNDGL